VPAELCSRQTSPLSCRVGTSKRKPLSARTSVTWVTLVKSRGPWELWGPSEGIFHPYRAIGAWAEEEAWELAEASPARRHGAGPRAAPGTPPAPGHARSGSRRGPRGATPSAGDPLRSQHLPRYHTLAWGLLYGGLDRCSGLAAAVGRWAVLDVDGDRALQAAARRSRDHTEAVLTDVLGLLHRRRNAKPIAAAKRRKAVNARISR